MAFRYFIKISFLFCFLTGYTFSGFPQCSMYEVPLPERVSASSLIVEGKVTGIHSYWNENKTMIYTANKIAVFKVFKGDITSAEIEVITVGGTVNDFMIQTSTLLKLKINDVGIFILNNLREEKTDNNNRSLSFEVFSSKQGFIQYDEIDKSASDIFNKYASVSQLHGKIAAIAKQEIKEVKSFVFDQISSEKSALLVPIISSFSPDTVSAGTKTRLTINGSGFGTSPAVRFSNADDGGQTKIEPLSKQYISISDNQIIVEVPDNAGTGRIYVVNGTTALSPNSLRVSYAYSNVTNTDAQARFINQSGGGYTWQMFTEFDTHADAKAAFLRSFENWRCATLVNWTIGENTTVDKTGKDNVNTIRFDRDAELDAGILGICYSYYSSCGNNEWYVSELDIVFDDDANWNYATSTQIGSRFDLETIALHELGHGHQLGHVINSSDLMHYSIAAGQTKRNLNDNNKVCAQLVLNNSTVNGICSFRPMTLITQEVCNDMTYGYFEFDGISAYPNPFDKTIQISYQVASETAVKAELFDIFGNKIITLADEVQMPGRHIYNLDNTGYAMNTGLYVFRLYLNGTLQTKKVIKVVTD